jgi:hypothetical protein
MEKSLFEQIIEVYPELTNEDFNPIFGTITLQDDSDGQGAYIAKWDYSQPLPELLTQYMRGSN